MRCGAAADCGCYLRKVPLCLSLPSAYKVTVNINDDQPKHGSIFSLVWQPCPSLSPRNIFLLWIDGGKLNLKILAYLQLTPVSRWLYPSGPLPLAAATPYLAAVSPHPAAATQLCQLYNNITKCWEQDAVYPHCIHTVSPTTPHTSPLTTMGVLHTSPAVLQMM